MAYGAVDRRVWNDERFRSWDRDTRDVWLYLLTCPHGNRLGCFVLPVLYVADDVQISPQAARNALERLEAENRIAWDSDLRVVCIRKHLHPDYNPLANESVVKAALKDLADLPDSMICLRALLASAKNYSRPHYDALTEELRHRVRQGVGHGVPHPEHEPDHDPDPESENNTPPDGGEGGELPMGNWTTPFVPIITEAMWLGPEPPPDAPNGWSLAAELGTIKKWMQDGRTDIEVEDLLLGACVKRDRGELGGVATDEGITCARLRYKSPYDVVDKWTKFPAEIHRFEGDTVGNYELPDPAEIAGAA